MSDELTFEDVNNIIRSCSDMLDRLSDSILDEIIVELTRNRVSIPGKSQKRVDNVMFAALLSTLTAKGVIHHTSATLEDVFGDKDIPAVSFKQATTLFQEAIETAVLIHLRKAREGDC